MEFRKITVKSAPWVNGAEPVVTEKNGSIEVTYVTDKKDEPGINGPKHTVNFKECLMYRVGDPNDEGFYGGGQPHIRNSTKYNKTDFPSLEFYELYEVIGSDWQQSQLGEGTVILSNDYQSKEPNEYKHYLWFMRDGSFECVAKGFEE
jgi:hypothetical protein